MCDFAVWMRKIFFVRKGFTNPKQEVDTKIQGAKNVNKTI